MTASTAERPSDKLTIAEVCADLDISRQIFITAGRPVSWKRDEFNDPVLSWLGRHVGATMAGYAVASAITLQLTRRLHRWLVRLPVLRPFFRHG